ncbi:MAG: hypothetical protein KKC75_06785 [Nanoarchaeota archaeon]|nr:hypothetical protein [Nanoarchaeota archaeon]MBU1005589.1 hypothetical protein [Nanoarchaeota archaeon]MBU1945975.1 hypothetical protein [Nanoarchaeota archaeon]
MKKIVWLNKSNGQLCVTIPKNSGIKDGDIINIEKEKIKTIIYSPMIADLFNYGHLRLLQSANSLGDFHICGVLTNEAVRSYREEPIADFRDRMSIISALQCIDMVMPQDNRDPTENLKKIHEQFRNSKLILVNGSNWKKVYGSGYIKKIGGEVVQPKFYDKLSSKNIIGKIFKVYKGGKVKNYGE